MGDWKRSTRECSLESMPPEVREAFRNHIERYNLGPILAPVLFSSETTSEKIKKNPFGQAETVATNVLLTPGWLIWAIRESRGAVTVVSARLADIAVSDPVQSAKR